MFKDAYKWMRDNKDTIEFAATFVVGVVLIVLNGATYV